MTVTQKSIKSQYCLLKTSSKNQSLSFDFCLSILHLHDKLPLLGLQGLQLPPLLHHLQILWGPWMTLPGDLHVIVLLAILWFRRCIKLHCSLLLLNSLLRSGCSSFTPSSKLSTVDHWRLRAPLEYFLSL